MKWQNRRGHLSLLRVAILAPPQVFTFASSPSKQAPLEGVDPGGATPNGAWLSLDLVAALLSLASDTELYAQVRKCFSRAWRGEGNTRLVRVVWRELLCLVWFGLVWSKFCRGGGVFRSIVVSVKVCTSTECARVRLLSFFMRNDIVIVGTGSVMNRDQRQVGHGACAHVLVRVR